MLKDIATTLVFTMTISYVIAYALAATIDRGHCVAAGAGYSHTGADLTGYCRVGSITVRAEGL